MHPLAERVRAAIRRHRLVPDGAGVLVALSGGSDSVALLLLLQELEAAGDLRVVGAAHFNHGLRGAAADADERFCRELADRLGVPFESGRGDVRALARAGRTSVENAGRRARYAFLTSVAGRLGATAVAIAHTQDDQAETVLQKLVRGAAWRGLAGIHPARGRLVRPVLDTRRHELRAYLAERGISFREDETNLDLANPRNRIRHELVPFLEAHFSPRTVETLARGAALARETADWLDTLAAERASQQMWRDGENVVVSVAGLRADPVPVAKAFAHAVLRVLAGGRFVGVAQVDALVALAAGHPATGTIDLPGQRAERRGDAVIVLTPRAGRGRRPTAVPDVFRQTLSIPGEALWAGGGWALTAEPTDARTVNMAAVLADADTTVVDASKVALPLAVRPRRDGDRFRPLGSPGRRKLQDFLVDRKVPRSQRDAVALVVDADDRIVWVAGHAVAHDFRVSAGATAVIILKRKRLGGAR